MKIQIYGTGCAKCTKLAENANAAAKQLGNEVEIEKITDINAITEAGVMMTPALGIDGKVVSTGKVLSPDEIAKLLQGGSAEPPAAESCSCCCSGQTPAASESSGGCCSGGKSNAKKILTILLLALVVFSIVAMVVRETRSSKNTVPDQVQTQALTAADVVVVYYFHGNQRCYTCNKIEELTKQAIESKFADQLASGRLVMRAVNVEAPENEHFIKDFALTTRSVVMQKGDKFEKFDQVWTLVREPEKFTAYIQNGAEAMLK